MLKLFSGDILQEFFQGVLNFLDILNGGSVSEFNELEPRLKSAKNRFQLSAGGNIEKLFYVEPTIFEPRLKLKLPFKFKPWFKFFKFCPWITINKLKGSEICIL